MRRRFVAQFSVVTGDAELFDQAKRGKQFRFTENGFGENLLVEKIEAPGPEPDQVDQENRDDDDDEENDGKEPLQNALKHETPYLFRCASWALGFKNAENPRLGGEVVGGDRSWSIKSFASSSPATDSVYALDQAADFRGDVRWQVAAFSLNSPQRDRE